MRKILLCALLIVTTYAFAIFLRQMDILAKKENMQISKAIKNFVTTNSYLVDALKNNKLKEDEKTILPHNEAQIEGETVYVDEIINQPQERTFDENTCKDIVLEYLKKSLYASDIDSYQSIGRGKIATDEYFAFNFFKNNMYLISYYIDNNFNIFYRDIFSNELRQAGSENLYRNISLNFDNSHKINKQNIIDLVSSRIGNENSKYEIVYSGSYNVNNRKMEYLYYHNDDDTIMELYYDSDTQELFYMKEILEPIIEN